MCLSLIFFEERTAFLDTAFYLFYIIKDSDFAIQNNRFGSCFTQIFPLVASKLNFDLQVVVQIYSAAYIILYAGIFFIILLWVKSYQFALVMLLQSTLMVTDTFYWIQSELPQGMAFLIFFFSVVIHKRDITSKVWYLPFIVTGTLTIAFFHPLILFPFLFIVAFFYEKENPQFKTVLVSLTFTFFGLLVIKQLFFKTAYDSSAIDGLKNFIYHFPNYISLSSNKNFIQYVLIDYQIIWLLFFCVIIFYWRKNNIYKLLLMIFSVAGYLLLVNVSYPNGGEQFYMENLYLPLSVMIVVPFVFDLVPRIQTKYVLSILCFILVVRIFQIGLNHQPYTERISYLKQIMEKTASFEKKKLIITSSAISTDTLMMTWASPYEFWLLSTIKNNQTRSIFITESPKEINWALTSQKKFITKWGAFDYHALPKSYFNFNDTTSYSIIQNL